MRLSIIKPLDKLPENLKPKLLTDEEFKEKKAKILLLNKEQMQRNHRKAEMLKRQAEKFR